MPTQTYDLPLEGKRFAVILAADGTAEPITQLTVLLNFFDELQHRVPLGKKVNQVIDRAWLSATRTSGPCA